MKIVQVDTYPLVYPLRQPYGDANGYKRYRSLYLFRITTQSGYQGWGEVADWLPALEAGFQQRLIPYLVGKQASQRLMLVHAIRQWHPRSAAGVSMALTEIAAQAAVLPVTSLWGGRWRSQVPVYASFQSYSPNRDWMKRSARAVERALSEGYRLLKVKVGGRPLAEDWAHIDLLQNQIQGRASLAIDANASYDLSTAKKWVRMLERWGNWLWFEEPLSAQRMVDYPRLRQYLSIPLSGGENLQQPDQVWSWFREGALDIWNPDPNHLGGIDTYLYTVQTARSLGWRLSPHTYDGMLSRYYALMAQTVLPPWSKMAGEDCEPVEWDVMENPFTALLPIRPQQGKVTLPEGVGLGVELDMELIQSLQWDGSRYW